MKIRVCFKDPQAVEQSLQAAAEKEVLRLGDADPDAVPAMVAEMKEKIGHWFRHGEYCLVEVDTEAPLIAEVVPIGQTRAVSFIIP